MKETSIYAFYAFGYNYNNYCTSWTPRTNADAFAALTQYLSKIHDLDLHVTKVAVEDLYGILGELEKAKGDEKIDTSRASKILAAIKGADKTLDAELKLKKVLSVTPKRFDIFCLLESPRSLLGQNTWDKLSDTAKKDFAEATRCIAMNLSTAAAFHSMRCVEETLKQLYFHFVKNGRMEKPMWAAMVDKLKLKNKPKPTIEILDHLDMLRRNFRNPTQHPQKFYSIDEAQDLLNSSIVALNGVCAEIK